MSPNNLPLWLTVMPVALALLVIAVLGWRREMQKRRAEFARREHIRTALLPEDGAYIATGDLVNDVNRALVGSFLLVSIGTYGLHQLQRLLILLYRCGLEKMVGSTLVVENDTQHRNAFHQAIPPIFYDRVVYVFSEQYDGGMANMPISDVLEQIDIWGVPLERGAGEVADLHLRRNTSRAPSNIFLFTSLGGHAPLGLPVMEVLRARFEDTLTVAFTALPVHGRLRQRFAQLKTNFEKRGVRGWVLSDNLASDPVTGDYGGVAMLVGLSDAALHADQATQVNNTLALALTQEPGAVLIYQVVTDSVVGFRFQPDPSVPPRYYVFKQPLAQRILKSLRRIEANKGKWSAELPVNEKNTSIFDIVLTSLYHPALQAVEDEVNAGRRLRGKQYWNGSRRNGTGKKENHAPSLRFGTRDYETPFASIATTIDPEKPLCPIIVVRLASVRRGAELVSEIVKVPEERSPRLDSRRLALPAGKKRSNGQKPRSNGTHAKEEKEKAQ